MLTVKKTWKVPKSTKKMKITCNYITKRLKKQQQTLVYTLLVFSKQYTTHMCYLKPTVTVNFQNYFFSLKRNNEQWMISILWA